MQEYDDEVLAVFLRNQGQLFDEPVAKSIVEAEAFLEDCMAIVVNSLQEVWEYFDENGVDIGEMNPEDIEEASEVFKLSNGRYLIVEG